MRRAFLIAVLTITTLHGTAGEAKEFATEGQNTGRLIAAEGTGANAQQLIDEALKKQIGNDFVGAAAGYRKALEVVPKNAKVHTDLATCLQQIDDFNGARDEYQRGLDYDKKSERENLYFLAVLDEHFNKGQAAYEKYLNYVKDNPNGAYFGEAQARIKELSVNVLKTNHLVTRAAQEKAAAEQAKAAATAQAYNDALQLQQDGKLDEAIAKYLEATKGSKDAAIWYAMGTAYQNKPDYDKAIESYEKALSLNPKEPNSKALIKQCKAAKAGPLFESAVKKQTTADEKGQYDLAGAILDYEKAAAINDDGTTRMNLGTAYQANNNLPKAIENYKRAVALDKNLFDCYYYMGTAQEGNKAPALAIIEYKKYLQFAPTGPNAGEAKERLKILAPAPAK